MVGMVSAGKIAPDTVKIFQLYVHLGHQRKGVGKRLMDGAINHFDGNKIPCLIGELLL